MNCKPFLVAAALLCSLPAPAAEPSVTGQSGLISMPDARFAPDGTWRTGLSFMRPYQTLWSSVTMFPWLETSFRYTRIYHVPPVFSGHPDDPTFGSSYGNYKDKAFDAKALVLPERSWWPAIGLGLQDPIGTGFWRAPYGVASKRFGEVDLTLGYGSGRIDGAFGGARWTPERLANWSLVAEYDAYNYKRDLRSDLSGAAEYKKEPAAGVEYRSGMWGAKAFSSHGHLGFNAYVSIPLEQRELAPKVDEPAPYTRINPRPTEEQWRADTSHRERLARALVAQDFRDVSLGYSNGRLEAALTNIRISSMPRAVGRAARTMLSFAPLEAREIRVTYRQGPLPVATYTFIDARLLQRYFNGMASRDQLAPYVDIRYASPAGAREERDRAEALVAFEEPLPESIVVGRPDAEMAVLRGENLGGGRLRVSPSAGVFFNDPSGAFKYDVAAVATYDRPLGHQAFLQAATRLTLFEDVSDVTQASNSTLPHVRTDIAEYKRASRFKLTRLLVNQYYQPAERVYARASAGIYEEMFSGLGGQVLYLPRDGGWGVDFAADWVKQRDFEGWFGYREYSTVTAIGSLNYRMAQGLTATLRAGRFLARDEGARVEVKRRFASGIEIGGWYTVTNGHDTTPPGSPDKPYHDKGVFMLVPLESLLTYDTQAIPVMSLSPWTRDVGQMVVSPGDLYRILERPVRQMHERDGLVRLGDREDNYDLPSLGTGRDRIWPDFVAADFFSARRTASGIDWGRALTAGAAITLSAAALDQSVSRYADRHRDSSALKTGVRLGDALPLVAVGLSAMFALDSTRPQLSGAGVAALEAGAVALAASTGLQYAVGRARPTAGEGSAQFDPGNSSDRFHSFPSRHTAVMWAVVTPYAEEFGMPWLYGVAAVTNAARAAGREHWLSDTVAGSLLGLAVGHVTWQSRRESRARRTAPVIGVAPGVVTIAWELD